jgi:hypothetical protein
MKNTKNFFGMAGLVLATMVLFSCGSGSGNSEAITDSTGAAATAKVNCVAQDVINETEHAINYSDANSMYQDFGTHFRDKNNPNNVLGLSEQIGYDALIALIEGFDSSGICTHHYVRGLSVSYAMSDDGRLVNLYQPVLFDKDKQTDPTDYNYNMVKDVYYTWDGSKFNKEANADALITNYKNNIEINRNGSEFTAFNDNSGATADDNTTSVSMTEKELQDVYSNNHGTGTNLFFVTGAKQENKIFHQDILVSATQSLTVTGTRNGWSIAVDDRHLPCPTLCERGIQLQ